MINPATTIVIMLSIFKFGDVHSVAVVWLKLDKMMQKIAASTNTARVNVTGFKFLVPTPKRATGCNLRVN